MTVTSLPCSACVSCCFLFVTDDKTTNDKILMFQVIVVNYEDAHTTMEAPDEDDESSYK